MVRGERGFRGDVGDIGDMRVRLGRRDVRSGETGGQWRQGVRRVRGDMRQGGLGSFEKFSGGGGFKVNILSVCVLGF